MRRRLALEQINRYFCRNRMEVESLAEPQNEMEIRFLALLA